MSAQVGVFFLFFERTASGSVWGVPPGKAVLDCAVNTDKSAYTVNTDNSAYTVTNTLPGHFLD